jgi:hypothetical protein
MKKVLLKRVLPAIGVLVVLGATFMVVQIGPRNVIGMLRYDQRRAGDLKVGDRAPDALLIPLDGKGRQALLDPAPTKPTILIFGSFT